VSWGFQHDDDVVVITERPTHEPIRKLIEQLRQLHYMVHAIRQLIYRETNRLPAPQVVFADVSPRDVNNAATLPSTVKATWEYVPVLLIICIEDLSRIQFGPNMHDFLALPIKVQELETRVRFALWKTQGAHTPREVIEAGNLRVNVATYEVWAQQRRVELTYKEFELVRFFMTHPRRVFSRAELLEKVWEIDYYGGTRTVDVHIRRLRAKLGPVGEMIHTVRNVGYRFS